MRIATLLALVIPALIASGPPAALAAEASTTFDGLWDVTFTCPPHNESDDDDAKGYTRRFPAEIKDGLLRGVYGTEGQIGVQVLTGNVAPDGRADLRLEGIVSRPDYAINKAQAGKAFTYRVRARFDATSGSGQRLSTRKCDFQFSRR
ncbi:MAG: hypothetical protein ACREUW_21695 [Burkholderiales bacterium]